MMRPSRLLFLFTIMPLPLAAAQVSLDFDDPAVSGYNYCLEEGFHIKSAGRLGASMQTGGVAYNGTRVIPVLSNLPPVTVTHIDSAPFTPLKIDLSEYSIFARPAGNGVPVTAVFGDGRELTHTFTLDGQVDGSTGTVADFQTFDFPAGWQNVVELRFTVSGFAFDNLILNGLPVPDAPRQPLPNGIRDFRILASLPANTAPWLNWVIHRVKGDDVLLAELSSRGAPSRYFHAPTSKLSPLEGPIPNPWTGERGQYEFETVAGLDEVYVPAFYLLPDPEDDENRVLLYRDTQPSPIQQVAILKVENGRLAFVSHWYGGVESYAVFIAEAGRLVPIVKPDTVLPDGGLPFHFPYQLYLEDGALAFSSSTTLSSQEDCWFLQFPDRNLLLGVKEGATLQGQAEPVTTLGKLLSLDRDRAIYYLHGNSRTWLVETTREGITRVLGASGEALTGRPVAGCGMRFIAGGAVTAMDTVTGIVHYGWQARADELGGAEDMHAVEKAGRLLPVCAGRHLFPGLNTPVCLFSDYAMDGTSFAVIIDGTRKLLVRFTDEPQDREPVLGSVIRLPDGSSRVMADNLTLDRPLEIQTAASPAGPWIPGRVFSPGSQSRSLPLPLQSGPAAFLRLRYQK